MSDENSIFLLILAILNVIYFNFLFFTPPPSARNILFLISYFDKSLYRSIGFACSQTFLYLVRIRGLPLLLY